MSLLLFAIVVDVITENVRKGEANELLNAHDLILISKTMKDLKKRFWFWKDALERKGLKINNTRKTKAMVSGSKELFKSKIDPCGVCKRRVMANSVLCTKCGNWVHGRCAKTKRVTARLVIHFVCSRCRGIMEGTVDSIKKLCDEVETVNRLCYLGNKLNSSGGCEAAVTVRVRIV